MTNKNGYKEDNCAEIEIPVPWGHIAGKWWGPKTVQPILAIHGWQDNAGTFDNLAPLLTSKGHSILCIDLPGHGLSSHFTPGHYYYVFWDGVHIVRRIVQFFNWKDIIIMGHSLGGAIAFLYAALYPNEIKKYISFDIASPSVRDMRRTHDSIGGAVDKFLKYESLTEDKVPCYEYEEMINIVEHAYAGGVTRESCKVMMRRGMKESQQKPGYYVFSRDPRLKVAAMGMMCLEQVLELASRITCEVLNIRANPGMKFDYPEHYGLVLDTIEQSAKRLERCTVEGTHHVHLNDPHNVVDIVDDFLTLSSN